MDNSLKYTDDKGLIEVKSETYNHHVRVIITDNGMGISEEDLPYIFDRFYRADKSRSKEKAGQVLAYLLRNGL